MLKRFIVENFSSYRDESILELTAGKSTTYTDHVVNFKNTKILKSAIIYGANASGKSNLIKAIEYAQGIIENGLNDTDTYKKYFRLDGISSKKETKFEFELELDGVFYSYGFSSILNTKEVSEEWLYRIDTSSPKMIFERQKNEISLGKELQGQTLKTRFDIYSEDMKNQSNQLFLNEIAKKELDIDEVKILNDIYYWFEKKLIILYPNSKYGSISSIATNNNLSKIFKKYLNEFDTGIIDISTIEEDFEKSLKDLPIEVKKAIEKNLIEDKKAVKASLTSNGNYFTICKDENSDLKVKKLGLIHNEKFGEAFELKDESDGTKRLFDLIPLLSKFEDDYTIVIDEFDRSLHPKLARRLFELFYKIEDSKSQLIVSTHESNLLDLGLLRRDEIWFAEKDKEGASKLFSLNQFKVRYDKQIEKAYLLGRYGAVPFFKTFDDIEWES